MFSQTRFFTRRETIEFLRSVAETVEHDNNLGVFRIEGDSTPGEDHFGVSPDSLVDLGAVIGARMYDAGIKIVGTDDINSDNILAAAQKRGQIEKG